MLQDGTERHVYRDKDADLYEEVKGVLFSGGTEVTVDGQRFNAARDRDQNDEEFFILTPVG